MGQCIQNVECQMKILELSSYEPSAAIKKERVSEYVIFILRNGVDSSRQEKNFKKTTKPLSL